MTSLSIVRSVVEVSGESADLLELDGPEPTAEEAQALFETGQLRLVRGRTCLVKAPDWLAMPEDPDFGLAAFLSWLGTRYRSVAIGNKGGGFDVIADGWPKIPVEAVTAPTPAAVRRQAVTVEDRFADLLVADPGVGPAELDGSLSSARGALVLVRHTPGIKPTAWACLAAQASQAYAGVAVENDEGNFDVIFRAEDPKDWRGFAPYNTGDVIKRDRISGLD